MLLNRLTFLIEMLEEKKTAGIDENVIFSVSEVAFHLRQVVETQIEALYINGEVSNFVKHGSGHLYFNLKDDNAVIKCAFFRTQNYMLNFLPQDGDQVICFGKITLFEKSGQLQLIVNNMFPYGKGALQQRYEQLKLKLKAEGLFDKEHKILIPEYPDAIGIITSPTGAALQDILNVLTRRYPCKVLVYPALMQGEEAAGQVIKGLEYFNNTKKVDVIVIARGGGSQEDLFCFNDEKLARAVYASGLPVVSAIGHEIDFTITDFVADLRAPTPSAAAELAAPDRNEIETSLNLIVHKMETNFKNLIIRNKSQVHKNQIKLMHFNPERVWQSLQQRFDSAVNGLSKVNDKIGMLSNDLNYQNKLFEQTINNLSSRTIMAGKHRIEIMATDIRHLFEDKIRCKKHRLDLCNASLEDLSVRKVLCRGFSIVRKNGKIVKSVNQLQKKDQLDIVLSDGRAEAEVTSAPSAQ